MPGTVASLQTFRLHRRDAMPRRGDVAPPGGGDGGDRLGTAVATPGTVAEVAAVATTAGSCEAADRDRRFRELALPHLDAAYNFARYLARDAAAAEDIVQDAFLRALRGFDGFRGGDPQAWILRIVRNRFSDWARERRLDPTVPLPDDLDDPDGHAGPELWDPEQASPEQALADADQAAAVQALVARLPAPFREVLVLREMEDLSYQQISEVIGTPLGTVMSRLARARRMFGAAWRRSAAGDEGRDR
jgi:RNA polymerase sigma-70 factor (ECF subfamily)